MRSQTRRLRERAFKSTLEKRFLQERMELQFCVALQLFFHTLYNSGWRWFVPQSRPAQMFTSHARVSIAYRM